MKHALLLTLLLPLLAPAQQLEDIKVNGSTRQMMVYAPNDIQPNRPLVISLHGANQDANYQKNQTNWNNCADTANFVVVYPQAINLFWDTGGQGDINFISTVIDEMAKRYDVDLQRVYVTGFSLGAMMTYHCIEHLGHRVAAFGPVSGVRFDNRAPIAPRRVPIIHTHGTGDDVFKWVGDPGHMAGGYPYIPDYLQKWATYLKLNKKEVIDPFPSTKPGSTAYLTRWTSEVPGDTIEVALLALLDKGHWHSEDLWSSVSTTQEIWNFCKRYTLAPAEPFAPNLLKIDPENKSFDMPFSMDTFTFDFYDVIDVEKAKATLVGKDASIQLPIQQKRNRQNVSFKIPEDANLPEGDYVLTLEDIYNPKGGKPDSYKFEYTYGITEIDLENVSENPSNAEIYKGTFLRLMERAKKIYEITANAKRGVIKRLRVQLEEKIQKYSDFASTSPSAYTEVINDLQEDVEDLESLYASGISDATIDADNNAPCYSIDGRRISAPTPGQIYLQGGTLHKASK